MFNSQPKTPSITSEIRFGSVNSGISKRSVIAITVVLAVVIVLLGLLFWRAQSQLNQAKKTLEQQQNDPAFLKKQETKELVDKVGMLIILPKDEEPTVATVTDLTKLEGQPFFAKAQVGDKVLIYQQDKKAILYRPSSNQIIELAPLINEIRTSP